MECLGMCASLCGFVSSVRHLSYGWAVRSETKGMRGVLSDATHGIYLRTIVCIEILQTIDDTCRHCNQRKLNGFHLMQCYYAFLCS